MRFALYTIGILVGGLVIAAMLVDEGELATLESLGADGRHWETQLWVVEFDAVPYLRAHTPDSDWLQRVRVRPGVKLTRDEIVGAWLASPVTDPALRDRVNAAMAQKYGTADRLLTLLFDPDEMVAVRLSPPPGA